MAAIDVNDLGVGTRLAYDVRDARGLLLLGAGRPITPETLAALQARGIGRLSIREWHELPEPARSEDGHRRAWLLAAGRPTVQDERADTPSTPATAHVGLGASTNPEAAPPPTDTPHAPTDLLRIRSILRRNAEDVVAYRHSRWKRLDLRVQPTGNERRAGALQFGLAGVTEDEHALGARIAMVRSMFDRLCAGGVVGAGAAIELADELVDHAERDAGDLSRAAIDLAAANDDAATRAYCTAAAAGAIAIALDWSRDDARVACLAGLFADSGAALIPWDIRSTPRTLTDEEANAVRRHPAYSAALLERVRAGNEHLPEQVQLAVHQHHEREDGSGYPRALRADDIHDAAKIVAVADVVIGLASPRADRPGMHPAEALNEIARQANRGTLWRPAAAAIVELVAGRVVVRGRSLRQAA